MLQDLQANLAEVHLRLDDHLSLLRSYFEMFHYDVNRALNNYLQAFPKPYTNVLLRFALLPHVRSRHIAKSCVKCFIYRFLTSSSFIVFGCRQQLGVDGIYSGQFWWSVFHVTCRSANRFRRHTINLGSSSIFSWVGKVGVCRYDVIIGDDHPWVDVAVIVSVVVVRLSVFIFIIVVYVVINSVAEIAVTIVIIVLHIGTYSTVGMAVFLGIVVLIDCLLFLFILYLRVKLSLDFPNLMRRFSCLCGRFCVLWRCCR